MFSDNIFRGTFNIDVVKQSMKKKKTKKKKKKQKKNKTKQTITSSKKALEDNMTPTVDKCVKLKSKLKLKCFTFWKSVIYLGVSTTV